jgi:thiamine-phosphate pyrophosphorylase
MTPRLFLVAPEDIADAPLIDCATAAAASADCASLVLQKATGLETIKALQALNLAVLLKDVDPQDVINLNVDGMLLSSSAVLVPARKKLATASLGLIAGVSRHAAMEAAEAGLDFVCFTQEKQYAGEPIIGWWQDVTEVPAVAYDPVTDGKLKSQYPDFIRPSDAMWQSPEAAAKVVTELMAKWAA